MKADEQYQDGEPLTVREMLSFWAWPVAFVAVIVLAAILLPTG